MISVIVPVYNTVEYLEDCLQSIADQNVESELIIVNDGADDGSEIICRKWAAEGRAVLIESRQEGLSAARNKGIKAATGKYISFVDSDDRLMPGALEKLLDIARRNPNCGIIEAQLSSSCKNHGDSLKHSGDETVLSAEDAIEATLYQKKGHNSSACGKLYRIQLFENELFVEGKWYEDLEFFPRIFSRTGRIAVTSCELYYYRPNPNSFINTYTPRRKDMLWATEKVLQFISSHYPGLIQTARSRRFSAVCNMFNLARAAGESCVARDCFEEICDFRIEILRNQQVRLKNKVAAFLSFGGYGFMTMVSRMMSDFSLRREN